MSSKCRDQGRSHWGRRDKMWREEVKEGGRKRERKKRFFCWLWSHLIPDLGAWPPQQRFDAAALS